jgi:hypothetical protein
MSPVEKQSFGTNGCEIIIGGEVSSVGAFCALQFVTEGSLASIASRSLETIGVIVPDITFPAGFVLYVPFTYVEVFSGTVVAYKSSL